MSLSASLQIGRSGLLTAQNALNVVGNNLANVATPGYHRQNVTLSPATEHRIGQNAYVGTGVQLQSITRIVDEALESRLRGSIADQSGSLARQNLLSQIEAIEGAFTDVNVSSKLSSFLNSWSNLANNPQDMALRNLVLQEGSALADFVQSMRTDLTTLRSQVDDSISNAADAVNNLLTQIEELNGRIAVQDHGTGAASGLRDRRDALLGELSKYLDVSTVESTSGSIDIFVGSLPIMLNGKSRGVELNSREINGQMQAELIVSADGSPLDISSGEIGALVAFRQQDLTQTIDTLDTFANQLIWQVNRVHSQGQGLSLIDSVTSSAKVEDTTAALNSADAGLDFNAVHGSFQIHVTQKSTGERITSTINVDLDGIDAGSDTTLASLAASIDAVDNVSASVAADGRLSITSDSGDFQLSFSDDSSGVLAALGINTFFAGGNAMDIAVNSTVLASPTLLAAGQGHVTGDNSNALAIAGLRDTAIDDLDGFSLSQFWRRHVEGIAVQTSQARQQVEADTLVRENLQAQQQAISGVNADEEAIDLLRYQRVYQANARFLSVVDELMQTLMNMI